MGVQRNLEAISNLHLNVARADVNAHHNKKYIFMPLCIAEIYVWKQTAASRIELPANQIYDNLFISHHTCSESAAQNTSLWIRLIYICILLLGAISCECRENGKCALFTIYLYVVEDVCDASLIYILYKYNSQILTWVPQAVTLSFVYKQLWTSFV